MLAPGYLKKCTGLCAQGILKDFGNLTLKIYFVVLWMASFPIIKSANVSHKFTASIEVLYIPYNLSCGQSIPGPPCRMCLQKEFLNSLNAMVMSDCFVQNVARLVMARPSFEINKD